MEIHPAHVGCVVGGGIAGSEAAARLAERRIHCVVIEMEALPYGKIELGLPKWHAKQRDQEERKIDQNLDNPYIHYVPCTRLGEDITLDEIQGWGLSTTLLAVGAWRDRPLAVPGIDEFQGKGFYYQNPFVAWFNQCHEPAYLGSDIELCDDAIVIGGGLASIDVVKILMLGLTQAALQKRGIEPNLLTMEKKGIPRTLETLGISWSELGLKGCTLYYRRRAQDMPLIPLEGLVDPAREEKAKQVRAKVLNNARAKYLFEFKPCRLPVDKVVEDDHIAGLTFRKTRVTENGVEILPDTEHAVRSRMVISSIGSLPELIPGVPTERELYRIENETTGKLVGFEGVFALGNAVTGRGNIRASRLHARQVSEWVMDEYLKWSLSDGERLAQASYSGQAIGNHHDLLSPDQIKDILGNASRFQHKAGYDGNYRRWVERHLPIRLENQ